MPGIPDMSTCPIFPVPRFGKWLERLLRKVSEENPDYIFVVIEAPEKRVLANFYAPSDASYPVIIFHQGQERRSRIQRGDTLDTMSFLPEELRANFREMHSSISVQYHRDDMVTLVARNMNN